MRASNLVRGCQRAHAAAPSPGGARRAACAAAAAAARSLRALAPSPQRQWQPQASSWPLPPSLCTRGANGRAARFTWTVAAAATEAGEQGPRQWAAYPNTAVGRVRGFRKFEAAHRRAACYYRAQSTPLLPWLLLLPTACVFVVAAWWLRRLLCSHDAPCAPPNQPVPPPLQVMAAEANYVRVDVQRLGSLGTANVGTSSSAAAGADGAGAADAAHGGGAGAAAPPAPPRGQLLCTVRALLKKVRQRVLVGDVVSVGSVDWAAGRGVVEAVSPRSSELVDPAVANVDHVVLLFGLTQPPVRADARACVRRGGGGERVVRCAAGRRRRRRSSPLACPTAAARKAAPTCPRHSLRTCPCPHPRPRRRPV